MAQPGGLLPRSSSPRGPVWSPVFLFLVALCWGGLGEHMAWGLDSACTLREAGAWGSVCKAGDPRSRRWGSPGLTGLWGGKRMR